MTGWSGGAKVLGKLPVPGRPTILITVGQGPTALAVGAGGGCLDIFTLIYSLSSLSPSLWETARYRLKYCLKGPFNPKQPTTKQMLSGEFCSRCMINKNTSSSPRITYALFGYYEKNCQKSGKNFFRSIRISAEMINKSKGEDSDNRFVTL